MTGERGPLIVVTGHGTALPAVKCPRMVVGRKTGAPRHCLARVRADRDGRPICAEGHQLTPEERVAAEAHYLDRLQEQEDASRTSDSG